MALGESGAYVARLNPQRISLSRLSVQLFYCLEPMRLVTPLAALLLLAGCNSDSTADQVALAEAEARTAEAEARAAEARAAEAAALNAVPSQPAPSTPVAAPTPQRESEPTVDYEPFGRPQSAYVQTQTDGQITLRSEPRANGRRVVRIVDGTQVAVLGCQSEARVRTDAVASGTPGRWCYVRTGNHDGWAFDAYLIFL